MRYIPDWSERPFPWDVEVEDVFDEDEYYEERRELQYEKQRYNANV